MHTIAQSRPLRQWSRSGAPAPLAPRPSLPYPLAMRRRVALLAAVFLAGAVHAEPTLQFAGRSWTVRDGGQGAPGVAGWSARNAFVDRGGRLHLRLTRRGGRWEGAEVISTDALGPGIYETSLDLRTAPRLDPNVVLGLFSYPDPAVAREGEGEVDVELTRWGKPSAPLLNFTAWPTIKALGPTGKQADPPMEGAASRHCWVRRPDNVAWRSTVAVGGRRTQSAWTYRPADAPRRISIAAMPMHFNLWSFVRPPSDGREVEAVITGFHFTPLERASAADLRACAGA